MSDDVNAVNASASNNSLCESPAKKVTNLHRRGLLSIGRNLLDRSVPLKVSRTGTLDGIAHWFELSDVTCKKNYEELPVFQEQHSMASSSNKECLNVCGESREPLGLNEECLNICGESREPLVCLGVDSPCSQAVFVADKSLEVTEGDLIHIDCVFRSGNFWLSHFKWKKLFCSSHLLFFY